MWRAVARLDDGKSDPLSIAHGVGPQCASLYATLSQVHLKEFYTEGGRRNMRRLLDEGELKLITSAILTYRASRRKQ